MIDCVEYTGKRFGKGYGHTGKEWAHRQAWIDKYGSIPKGMYICHKCDNPPCININHLYLGTHGSNSADSTARGRQGKALNWDKATEIRQIRDTLGYSHRKIAKMFNVSSFAIAQVLRNETWRI